MPSFFLKWSLDKTQNQTKHPHHQDLIWSQRQKPPIADGTTNSEGSIELALFRDDQHRNIFTQESSKPSSDSPLSSHLILFVFLFVYLAHCFLSKLIFLLLFSARLYTRLHAQPHHWALRAWSNTQPFTKTLSFVLHFPSLGIIGVGVRSGWVGVGEDIQHFFPSHCPSKSYFTFI